VEILSAARANNMTVSIELMGLHRDIAKIEKIIMPITGNTPLRNALAYIRQLYPQLVLEENMVLITVNHEVASLDRLLVSNDTVCILPHIGGG
jgi:molybdopterin converting factor small subunit